MTVVIEDIDSDGVFIGKSLETDDHQMSIDLQFSLEEKAEHIVIIRYT